MVVVEDFGAVDGAVVVEVARGVTDGMPIFALDVVGRVTGRAVGGIIR